MFAGTGVRIIIERAVFWNDGLINVIYSEAYRYLQEIIQIELYDGRNIELHNKRFSIKCSSGRNRNRRSVQSRNCDSAAIINDTPVRSLSRRHKREFKCHRKIKSAEEIDTGK